MPREDDWSNKNGVSSTYFGRGMLKYGLLGPLEEFEVIRGLSRQFARDLLCVQFQSNESGFFFKKDTLKYSFSQMSHKFQSNESASGFAGADFIRLFRSL